MYLFICLFVVKKKKKLNLILLIHSQLFKSIQKQVFPSNIL